MEQAIETIDLRYYLSVLQKWRVIIAVITVISVLTAAFLSFFVLPPVYETKVMLMVSNTGMQRMTQYQPDDLRGTVGMVSRLPEMTVNTYVSQLTSAYFMTRVIKRLDLDTQLYTALGIARLVEPKAIKDTNLIEIKVSNNNPKLATDIANGISFEFIDYVTENLQEQMAKSVKFLEEQAQQADKELAKANEQLRQAQVGLKGVEFLSREIEGKSEALKEHFSAMLRARVEEQSLKVGLDSLSAEIEAVPRYLETDRTETNVQRQFNPLYRQIEQQLADKRIALAEKTALRTGYEASVKQLTQEITGLQQGQFIGGELFGKEMQAKSLALGEHLAAMLRAKVEEQSLAAGVEKLSAELQSTPKYLETEEGGTRSLRESNPLYQQVAQQLADKRVALAEKSALRMGYEASVKQLTEEITLLQPALAQKKTEEYRLSKQVAQLEQAYSLLKEKIIQTQMARSMNIGEANISIVAPAVQPVSPVSPRKALNCAVAGILGLMVSVGLAFVLEYIDYTIKSPDDVVKHLSVPALGSVPVITGERRSTGSDK